MAAAGQVQDGRGTGRSSRRPFTKPDQVQFVGSFQRRSSDVTCHDVRAIHGLPSEPWTLAATTGRIGMDYSQPSKPARIPSLDGLRALSICGVLLSHVLDTFYLRAPITGMGALLTYGNLGVRVFFAVSGFLITTLLLREERATGGIELRAFYLRRTFRILPTYWTFLLVVLILQTGIPTRAFLISLSFLSNFFFVPWPLGHSWSLAVEEQFYLLWPTIILLSRRGGRMGAVIALWLVAPLFRLLLPLPWRNQGGIQNNLDSLMAGCFLAIQAPRLLSLPPRFFGRGTAALVSALFCLVVSPIVVSVGYHRFPSIPCSAITQFVESFAIANVIWYCVNTSTGVLGRFLNSRPLVHIGVISYGLYIWQQIFLLRALDGAGWIRVCTHLIALFVVAEVSHRVIEMPMIRYGRQVQRRWLMSRDSVRRTLSRKETSSSTK